MVGCSATGVDTGCSAGVISGTDDKVVCSVSLVVSGKPTSVVDGKMLLSLVLTAWLTGSATGVVASLNLDVERTPFDTGISTSLADGFI